MSRSLLAIHKINDFVEYCKSVGIETREGRGDYEVLQVRLKSGNWMPIFKKDSATFHVTVPNALHGIVWKFIKHGKSK